MAYRLTKKEVEQRKQENSLANWSSVIVKRGYMTFEEKKEVFDNLTQEQKDELRGRWNYFESMLWCTEPYAELFGVSWGQQDLGKLFNG